VTIAVDVDDVDRGTAVSRDTKHEDRAATIRRDVDLRAAASGLPDTHPGADRGEPPQEQVGCHGVSLLLADVG
jgi:hypothetical protein